MTYVDHGVNANLFACTAGVERTMFRVSTGEHHRLNELLHSVSEIVGNELKPDYTRWRTGDVRHSLANIDRAQQLPGYQSRVRFSEALRRSVTWFQEARPLLGGSSGPRLWLPS